MDHKRILLTGAAGFIGSYLLGYLNKKGYTNIIIADDFTDEDKWFNFDSKQFIAKIERENQEQGSLGSYRRYQISAGIVCAFVPAFHFGLSQARIGRAADTRQGESKPVGRRTRLAVGSTASLGLWSAPCAGSLADLLKQSYCGARACKSCLALSLRPGIGQHRR